MVNAGAMTPVKYGSLWNYRQFYGGQCQAQMGWVRSHDCSAYYNGSWDLRPELGNLSKRS